MTGTTGFCGDAKHPLNCRLREAEVQEWMESASQSDRGFEEAQAKGHQVGFPLHPKSRPYSVSCHVPDGMPAGMHSF